MKIKRATKLLILTFAVAAVLGVSAVSFAQWTGSTPSFTTANASVGQVELIGFTGVTTDWSLGSKKLIPYDQGLTLDADDDRAYVLSNQLPVYEAQGDYKIKVTLASSDKAGYSFKVLVDDAGVTAVNADTDFTDWKSLTLDAGSAAEFTFTQATYDSAVTSYLSVALVSADNRAMNATVSFKVELVQA